MFDPGMDRRSFLTLGAGALAVALAPPLLRARERLVRRTFPMMGTVGEIAIPARHEASTRVAVNAAIGELQRVEHLMSRFRADSDIGRVNAAAPGQAVPVSPETAEVIRDALAWAEETGGVFDPCLARLSELWDPTQVDAPPAEVDLAPYRSQSLWRAVEVDGDPTAPRVRRHRAVAALDLGGIAKGYGVDRAVAVLNGFGVTRGLVNLGGDLMALGVAEGGHPWRIGVRDPLRPDQVIATLEGVDAAIATSGDYLRYFEYGGRRYHHLLDPVTGSPRTASMHTVTVRASSVCTADAAATAAFGVSPAPDSYRPFLRSDVRIVHRG
ncbi:MAG: FAD:protein FMN transferase [Longimicrobiales bacterium]|nr:FAD:protein FMN transferase [Longimicrobiales bacterium]